MTSTYRELEHNEKLGPRPRVLPSPNGLEAWCSVVIVGLNALWLDNGLRRFTRPRKARPPSWDLTVEQLGTPTKQQVFAFWSIERRVEAFLGTEPCAMPVLMPRKFLASRSTSYSGEMVRRAEPLAWAQVEPALPPPESCASIDILDLCDDRMKEWFLNPRAT